MYGLDEIFLRSNTVLNEIFFDENIFWFNFRLNTVWIKYFCSHLVSDKIRSDYNNSD